MKTLSIAEIVENLQKAKTKTERASLLRQNDCMALRGLLRMVLDSSLSLSLPTGAPPYRKSPKPDGYEDMSLRASAKGWSAFIKELSPNLTQAKREKLFIDLLEKLNQKEAEILIQAKDRKLDLGVTKKLVDEVFPGLIKSEAKINGKKESTDKTTDSSNS